MLHEINYKFQNVVRQWGSEEVGRNFEFFTIFKTFNIQPSEDVFLF